MTRCVPPVAVHGARHDAHAFVASGLADLLAECPTVADLGYVGVEGIDTVPFKRLPGSDLYPSQVEFNTALNNSLAAFSPSSLSVSHQPGQAPRR